MPVQWNLKKWLVVNRNIYRPTELRTLLHEKSDIQLSLQAVSALINSTPSALRLSTIQALCDALDCKLSDFCEVLPNPSKRGKKQQNISGGTLESLGELEQ